MKNVNVRITKSAVLHIQKTRCDPDRQSVQRMCKFCTDGRLQHKIVSNAQLFRECYYVTSFCPHKCRSDIVRHKYNIPCPDINDIEYPVPSNATGFYNREALGDMMCIEEYNLPTESTEEANPNPKFRARSVSALEQASSCNDNINLALSNEDNTTVEYEFGYTFDDATDQVVISCQSSNKTVMEEHTRETRETETIFEGIGASAVIIAVLAILLSVGVIGIILRKIKNRKSKKEENKRNSHQDESLITIHNVI